jgi:hypothetical protein
MRHGWIRTLLLFTLAFCACDASRPQAYITPLARFNKSSVPLGTPVEVTYSFQTSPGFSGLRKNLVVFVHFVDPRGTIRFVDDHTPPILTNQWTAGRTYSYTRTIMAPENIPVGEYLVELGMYNPVGKGESFALNARRVSERSYDVGHLVLRQAGPQEIGEFLSGWHDAEREPGNPWEHWRWTTGAAALQMPNPKTDSFVYLSADSDVGRFADPQRVVLFVNGAEIARFAMDNSEPVIRKFPVNSGQLGNSDTVDLRLEVDQTFTPGGNDTRSLGIRVYCLYLGPARD